MDKNANSFLVAGGSLPLERRPLVVGSSPLATRRSIGREEVLLPSIQVTPDPFCRPPSLESVRMLGLFSERDLSRLTVKEEGESAGKRTESEDSMDCSSTPFLSLKHHPSSRPLPPRGPPPSNTSWDLPFRTVAEPTVDLFDGGGLTPPSGSGSGSGLNLSRNTRKSLFSFSDDALGSLGVRKTPSLEALLSSVLGEIRKGEATLPSAPNS